MIPALGHSPRWVLQTLGTEWGRNALHRDVWVDAAIAKAKKLMAAGKSVVIDDMRFPNERAAVWRNGSVWMVLRRDARAPATAHPSEGLLTDSKFDHVIFNNGSKTDLYRYVEEGLVL